MELTDLYCLQMTCPNGIGYTLSLGLNSPAYRLADPLRLEKEAAEAVPSVLNATPRGERWCLVRQEDGERDGAQSADDLRGAIHGDREP